MGIGDWGLGPIPNPQSPIPNPQSPTYNNINIILKIIYYLNIKFIKKYLILLYKNVNRRLSKSPRREFKKSKK